MTDNLFRKTIAVLIILHFIIPAEFVYASFGNATVEFKFITYSGNSIDRYCVKAEVYDEKSNLIRTFYDWDSTKITLEAFKTYYVRMTLSGPAEAEYGTEPDDTVITRTFKTRTGYKLVTLKLPEDVVVKWTVQLQEYINGVKQNASYDAKIELRDPETNKLRDNVYAHQGTGFKAVKPGLYNLKIYGMLNDDIEHKEISRFPIFKEKTSYLSVQSSAGLSPLTFIFRKPLQYDAKVTVIGKTLIEDIIPAGSESMSYNIKPGIYNVNVTFRTGDIPLGTYINEYRVYPGKARVITLWEMDYSKYEETKEKVPVEVCSTDSGNKIVIIKDPVFNTELVRGNLDFAGCTKFNTSEGEYTHIKNRRLKIRVENSDTGKFEEKTVLVTDTPINFGNNDNAMSQLITIKVMDSDIKSEIPNWTGKIRRLSDNEFFGTKVTENGETNTSIDSSNPMIYLPPAQSRYEISIGAEGYMQAVKEIKTYKPRAVDFYLHRASQMKPVTLNLTAVSDTKGLIIKDVIIYVHYYGNDEAGASQKNTAEIGDKIPIQGIINNTSTSWSLNFNLPENKTFYIQPIVYFDSNNSKFTYIFKPQKHKIKPISESQSDTIDMPVNVLGTEHKIVIIEKHGKEKDRVDNVPVSIYQKYYNNQSMYGIKDFSLEIDSMSPDQTVWLPDGIFIQANLTTSQRDLYKFVKNAGIDYYYYPQYTVNSKVYKTPIQYDKTKYDMPALIMTYQKAFHHSVNAKVTVKLNIDNKKQTVIYDLTNAVFKMTSDKGYKDSMKLPTYTSTQAEIDWIIGLPEPGNYTAELIIPYKIVTGDKPIYNSKGEIWKTVPVYERKNLTISKNVDVNNSGGGAIIVFDLKLLDDNKTLSIVEDKSKVRILKPSEGACAVVLVTDGPKYFEVCGSKWETITCGEQESGAFVTDLHEISREEAMLRGGATFKLQEEDGKFKYYSLNTINITNAGFAQSFDNPNLGVFDIITRLGCGTCYPYGEERPCVYFSLFNGPLVQMPSNWYGGGPGGFTIGNLKYPSPPDIANKEKRITVRFRSKDPSQVFPLSQVFVDPSKRIKKDNVDEPAKAYKNTYVEFSEIRPDGYSGKKIEKVWIDKTISSQYSKTWIVPMDPEREVRIVISVPSRFGYATANQYFARAEKGQNVTVDVEYNPDFGEVNLSPGTRYDVNYMWFSDGGKTLQIKVSGITEFFKISGIQCPDSNKECFSATKTLIEKLWYYSGPYSAQIELDSLDRDNFGALQGKLYISGVDVAQELMNQGIVVKVKPMQDRDYYEEKQAKIIIKAYAGGNKTFAGKKVYVTVNPDILPTMRQVTQGTTSDALAYWGGHTHELEVDSLNPGSTKEATISVKGTGGGNVKLLFFTSDTESFIQKTWLAQLLQSKADWMWDEFEKFFLETGIEEINKSGYLKKGDFSYAVKNVTLTTANYHYVNATIPTLGTYSYSDYKVINAHINATSTKGFRASLVDLTAAGTIVEAANALEKNLSMKKFETLANQQKDIWERANKFKYTGDYFTYQNERYKVMIWKGNGTWKTLYYDLKLGKEITSDEFLSLLNRNLKLLSAYKKYINIPKGVLKALTLQPFTKIITKAFKYIPYADIAARYAIIFGMGLPLSGMPLVKVQSTMESKNGVMEALDASPSFQAIDWIRNFFNKPLVAKTLTIPVKVRKGKNIFVNAIASGHEPFKSLIPITDEMWNSGELTVNMSLNTNYSYTYSNLEAFFQHFPLLQERIEEFALAPEMYATTSERQDLITYMSEGFSTLANSLLKDFTPFATVDNDGNICDTQPWLPECGGYVE